MAIASSITRSPSVIVYEESGSGILDGFKEAIIVSRNSKRFFTVYTRTFKEKYDGAGSGEWLILNVESGMRDPRALLMSIESTATRLDVKIYWPAAITELAKIDYVVAAIIAETMNMTLPAPPSFENLLQNRPSCVRGHVEVFVEWGYELHAIKIAMRDWFQIVGGSYYSDKKKYWYEGVRYTANWVINGYGFNSLFVGYDDGGVSFEGALLEAEIHGPKVFNHDLAILLIEAAFAISCETGKQDLNVGGNLKIKKKEERLSKSEIEAPVTITCGHSNKDLIAKDYLNNKDDEERLSKLEKDYPGITRSIQYFENADLPSCIQCGSNDTADVQIGVIGRTIAIAGMTRKFRLIPNGPRPGTYYCRTCNKYFD
jgi:hypothetical protein